MMFRTITSAGRPALLGRVKYAFGIALRRPYSFAVPLSCAARCAVQSAIWDFAGWFGTLSIGTLISRRRPGDLFACGQYPAVRFTTLISGAPQRDRCAADCCRPAGDAMPESRETGGSWRQCLDMKAFVPPPNGGTRTRSAGGSSGRRAKTQEF